MSERSYCCEVAQQIDSSRIGSAVQVDVWLLIEYAYPWNAKALEDNILPGATNGAIERLTQAFADLGLSLRAQFIKQAATELHSPKLFFADGRDGQCALTMQQIDGYDNFPELDAARLLDGTQSGFSACSEEIYLVCTNGQRDICCARFGRPLYSNLHAKYGNRIWQTTHVGGHRYAPNLLCLPSGYLYGNVAAESGVELVAQHDRGELDVTRLRGRCHYQPHVQAGEIFARSEHQLFEQAAMSCEDGGVADGLVVSYSGAVSGSVKLASRTIANLPSDCEPTPKPSLVYSIEYP